MSGHRRVREHHDDAPVRSCSGSKPGCLYDWKTYYFDQPRPARSGILGYGLVLTVDAEPAGRRDGRVGAADGADGDGLDGAVRVPADARRVAGGRPEATSAGGCIDLWNNLYLCGLWCLQAEPDDDPPAAAAGLSGDAWLVVGGVCAACLLYLRRRVQAVEIVS